MTLVPPEVFNSTGFEGYEVGGILTKTGIGGKTTFECGDLAGIAASSDVRRGIPPATSH
jgi:hypothetical protein